jgi:hypothetical protein
MIIKTLDKQVQDIRPGIEDLNVRMAFLERAHKLMLIAEFDAEYFKNEITKIQLEKYGEEVPENCLLILLTRVFDEISGEHITGLRMSKPVENDEIEALNFLKEKGYVNFNDDYCTVTQKGVDFIVHFIRGVKILSPQILVD